MSARREGADLLLCTLVALVALGCAPGERPFARAPVVWRVADDRHIPEPADDDPALASMLTDVVAFDPIDRALTLPRSRPALDTNALDEVPDSTWFENRIGRYLVSPEDVARGPGGAPPELPITILVGKMVGEHPGFRARDARGRTFVVKLDPLDLPDAETAAAAIASRLFWAAGYHVPMEHVIHVPRDQIDIARDATWDDTAGYDHVLDTSWVNALLAERSSTREGFRMLASKQLPGTPKGGFWPHGRRRDDPNDTIPHQHRRVLRGLRVFCAWLDHTDINPRTTLDTYVTEGGRRFLRHHLVGFDQTLGTQGIDHPWTSWEHMFDAESMTLSLISLGVWQRRWESEPPPLLPTVGRFFAAFDPTLWKEDKPYAPFREMTPADAFWAAKIVLAFDRDHIDAAVREGKITDPAAAHYVATVLEARARRIGEAYVATRTALDGFRIEGEGLCAVDLAVRHRLAAPGFVERLEGGRVVQRVRVRGDGRVCVDGAADASYRVVTLRTVRGAAASAPVEVHVHGGPSPRILGVARE